MSCSHSDCPREARAAIKTRRPQRDNVTTQVWWDDRAEKVPKGADRYCREHTLATLLGLANVLVDEDDDVKPENLQVEPEATVVEGDMVVGANTASYALLAECPACGLPAEVPGEGRFCGRCQDYEGHCRNDHCMTCGGDT